MLVCASVCKSQSVSSACIIIGLFCTFVLLCVCVCVCVCMRVTRR